jgi:uncharacterized delta-60 repeat protein
MFNTNLYMSLGSSNVTTKVLFGNNVGTLYGGVPVNGFLPLNNRGDLDLSFNIGIGFNSGGGAYSLLKSSYGGYYFGGFGVTTYRGISCGNLGRLNIDGSLDSSLNTAGKFNNGVLAITEDSSGNIYVGGQFTNYDGTGRNYIVKLDRFGVLDTSFNPVFGTAIIYTIAIDSNGKIYVGGSFTTVNSQTNNNIIRLNPDGTKDTGFDNTTGFNTQVKVILISSTGKIYAGGFFTTYKSQNYRALIRLNTDGSIDTAFATALKFEGGPPSVWQIAEDDEGNVYATGSFTAYNPNTIRGICKLDTSANFVPFLSNPTSIPTSFASVRTPENQFYVSANNGLHFISATGAPVPGFVAKSYNSFAFSICLI